MTETEPWLSLEQIAQHVGVSTDTIHRWIRLRDMPAHKVGRLWKFKVSQVDAWVRAGTSKQDSEETGTSGPDLGEKG
jgi:excisionase family DNA binding protein